MKSFYNFLLSFLFSTSSGGKKFPSVQLPKVLEAGYLNITTLNWDQLQIIYMGLAILSSFAIILVP